jgi:hypothetical protein
MVPKVPERRKTLILIPRAQVRFVRVPTLAALISLALAVVDCAVSALLRSMVGWPVVLRLCLRGEKEDDKGMGMMLPAPSDHDRS